MNGREESEEGWSSRLSDRSVASNTKREFPADALVFSFLLMLVAMVLTFFVWFRGIEVPHCESRCDFTLLYWASTGYAIFSVVVVVACISLVVAGWLKSFKTFWIPLGGASVLVVGAMVANAMASQALLY
jgi:hypothetical protein